MHQGPIRGSSACKKGLHKCASKCGSSGPLNKHGHTFYQSKIPSIHSELVPISTSKANIHSYAEK